MSRRTSTFIALALISGLVLGSDTPSGDTAPAAPPNVRLKPDFDRKVLSASALLDAEKRFSADYNNQQRDEIAAHETALAQARSTATQGDLATANRQIDDLLLRIKRLITSTRVSTAATADLKTGSAALGEPAERRMSPEEKKTELAKTLRGTIVLRDLIARRSTERGIDASTSVALIDRLLDEARRLEASDPGLALQRAGTAYDAARAGVESLGK